MAYVFGFMVLVSAYEAAARPKVTYPGMFQKAIISIGPLANDTVDASDIRLNANQLRLVGSEYLSFTMGFSTIPGRLFGISEPSKVWPKTQAQNDVFCVFWWSWNKVWLNEVGYSWELGAVNVFSLCR